VDRWVIQTSGKYYATFFESQIPASVKLSNKKLVKTVKRIIVVENKRKNFRFETKRRSREKCL